MGNNDLKQISQKLSFPLYFLYICNIVFVFFNMYGLYDRDGILRFFSSDREACLDYSELFELNSSHCCLMNLISSVVKENKINLDLNQAENNN